MPQGDNVLAVAAMMPQPELFRELAPEPGFLGCVPARHYLFLTAERRDVYAVILNFLYLRRHAHEIEKYHNDIYDAVQPTVESVTEADYSLGGFRADMEQLVVWGNIERRLEPYRLQHIADRRLQKYLYRLAEPTRALLDSLTTLRAPGDAERIMLDHDHLSAVEEHLGRAEQIRGDSRARNEDSLRRVARCFVDIDATCRDIATEITEFGARMATFNTAPFQLEELPEIIDWLDRYVEQYLQRVGRQGAEVYHHLREWNIGESRALLKTAEQSMREHVLANPLASQWISQIRTMDEILLDIVPFFAPEGLLAVLCQRVNEQVRALVRKIRQHLDDIRRRNVRMQALRRRTREVLQSDDTAVEELREFLKELVGSGHQVNDAGRGTPSRRAAPPRPTYWRRRVARPAFQSATLERKQGSVARARELERARMARLGAFINERLLAGTDKKRVGEVELETPVEVRMYVDAVKAYFIARERDRQRLAYRVVRPDEGEDASVERAQFETEGWRFGTPDFTLEQRKL
jgi:hypothetical protein